MNAFGDFGRRGCLIRAGTLLVCGCLFAGCTTGEGSGFVRSERLFIEGCWNGPFDLEPDFFGANPVREEQLMIRIQRGDDVEELSDGMIVLVNDLQRLREEAIGQPVRVGLPPGVTPPGVPIELELEPADVSLALYLHNTCHGQNSAVYAVDGTITFTSLFSGDPNEPVAEKRLTEAEFTAQFADPRALSPISDERREDVMSTVTGRFHFFFQRGQPAQPFQ